MKLNVLKKLKFNYKIKWKYFNSPCKRPPSAWSLDISSRSLITRGPVTRHTFDTSVRSSSNLDADAVKF